MLNLVSAEENVQSITHKNCILKVEIVLRPDCRQESTIVRHDIGLFLFMVSGYDLQLSRFSTTDKKSLDIFHIIVSRLFTLLWKYVKWMRYNVYWYLRKERVTFVPKERWYTQTNSSFLVVWLYYSLFSLSKNSIIMFPFIMLVQWSHKKKIVYLTYFPCVGLNDQVKSVNCALICVFGNCFDHFFVNKTRSWLLQLSYAPHKFQWNGGAHLTIYI